MVFIWNLCGCCTRFCDVLMWFYMFYTDFYMVLYGFYVSFMVMVMGECWDNVVL